jgi:hypothetical protein
MLSARSQAMLFQFSPVHITPSSDAELYHQLEIHQNMQNNDSYQGSYRSLSTIALYSIDCTRKLLIHHNYQHETIFDQLDEAREAEMKHDEDFWTRTDQVEICLIILTICTKFIFSF